MLFLINVGCSNCFKLYLHLPTAMQRPGFGLCGRVGELNKSVYSTLFLDG